MFKMAQPYIRFNSLKASWPSVKTHLTPLAINTLGPCGTTNSGTTSSATISSATMIRMEIYFANVF